MNIVVCIKQVPDTNEVRLDPVTNTLIRDGVPSIINPDDKSGLEVALRLKDENPDIHVTVLSMGPPQAQEALREALAMGADDGILVSDRAFGGADTWATSCTITAALQHLDFDLIICGRQAIDGDTAQVGPQIAEHIGVPQVSYVEELELDDDKKGITVKRQFEDRYHTINIKFPCLITAIAELAEPRYMTIGKVFEAYQKEIRVWGLEDIKDKLDMANIGLKGSPTKVRKSFPKQGKGKGVLLTDLTADEAAQAIVAKLQEKYII
ncbi:electron transfer flavoprotein subunit beta/FixA family protein [Peptoniphilus harei]|uniref:electron transfer flavoprotein subunit beta/FixA family protein n=1 Tax=Peptoniphilus harei TaxID=54005 RepID=UPI0022E4CDC8|nr:electron transfer flavoprotein subunit beta/FixA family protein [Peptoniphilus harei]MDK7354156.1 electron transfer flavoprotein subunit beta/FixA family protein [Peptoniphilus harei]MDK7370216.1 electron transfer flavoprotein subunit beta/FixA family protein [Peptoniphilus harei]MDU2504115.1 electron transfer flavoprotein subunit beta/FixA family protein [Peptoniphilus harei]MDU3456557.1 electron transfer flavoprotein subunit beta/FixA family protein [Peptoniphilus harei]